MKKNLEYYQHRTDSHNHPKFKMLRQKYGWEGEGRFWALNNIIASSENCKLNLKKGYNKSMTAYDLGLAPDEFDKYLIFISKVCNLITYKNGVVTTEITQENFKKVHSDRIEARKRYKKTSAKKSEKLKSSVKKNEVYKFSGKKLKTSGGKIYKLNQTKLNKTKLNKTKLNKTKSNQIEEKENLPLADGCIFEKENLLETETELKYILNGKTNEHFEKFWRFYNRRDQDKSKVRQVFTEVIKSEADFTKLIEATRNYNSLTSDKELKFLKMPANFLLTYKDFINIEN